MSEDCTENSGQCFPSAPGPGVMGREVIYGKSLETMTQLSALSPWPPQIKEGRVVASR